MLRVQQLMTQNVHACGPDDSLDVPARIMWEQDVGVVPVVDDAGRVVAMLTDRDACMGALTTGRPLSAIRVREAMSKQVFGTTPDSPVEDAERVMRDHQVRRLPVLDAEGRLQGILSQNDLVGEAARERETHRKELSAVRVNATLAAIGQSRAGTLAMSAA